MIRQTLGTRSRLRPGLVVALLVLAPFAAGAQEDSTPKRRWLRPREKPTAPAATAEPGQAQPGATPQPAQGPRGLTAAQQRDTARLLPQARELDANRDETVENADRRVQTWRMVLLADPNNLEARMGFEQARGDLDRAREEEVARREAQESEASERQVQLRQAENALASKDFKAANRIVNEVLVRSPSSPRAMSLRASIRAAQHARAFRMRLIGGAAILVILAAVIGVLARKKLRKKGDQAGPVTVNRGLLKIVEGVGRGKLATIDKDIFRIGAAKGTGGEVNDLIVSDSASAVSRFHCTIVRRGEDFFLIDASVNGTVVNGEPVEQGQQLLLDDGDEFILAGVSRLTFMQG